MDLAQTRVIYVDRTKNGGLLKFTSLQNLLGAISDRVCVYACEWYLWFFLPCRLKKGCLYKAWVAMKMSNIK